MTYNEYLDFYNILKIAPGASKEEIKAAYLLLAKQYHPDRFQTTKDKLHAEIKFRKIAAAYDGLKSADENYDDFMKDNSFSSFFDEEYSKINDFGDDSAAFLKFYFSQQEIEKNEQTVKNKKTEKSEKTDKTDKNTKAEKNKKTTKHNFKYDAIHVIEKYIKDNKLNLIYVYECLKTNKSIITVGNKIDDFESYSGLLVKEVIYRHKIKETKEYENYIKNHSYFRNIDLSATLHVDPTYTKKQFEEHVTYKSKKICLHCSGLGCDKCKNGFIEFDHTINIKVPYVSRQPMFFEIKDGGNQSKLGNGKLFLEVIFTKNKINELGYKFELKKKYQITLDPIVQAANFIWTQLKNLYEIIIANKHVSSLYFVIAILLVAIICLAVLL